MNKSSKLHELRNLKKSSRLSHKNKLTNDQPKLNCEEEEIKKKEEKDDEEEVGAVYSVRCTLTHIIIIYFLFKLFKMRRSMHNLYT